MQLFSRKKALSVLSLGALVALGACGDDVTVPVAPDAPIVVTITPPNANMNVGESLSFAVQISGGSSTAAPTLANCTSSNTAVATAAVSGSACTVTAVAAGNATITAAASTGQTAAAGVSVSAPPAAITGLSVSPSAAQLGVGQQVTLVPTVQPAGRTATYAYTSSSNTIATVSAAGVVTAVAPGVATITVTASAPAGAGLAAATISQAVTITVSERTPGLTALNVQPATVALALGGSQALTASVQGPRASAATITYGTSAPAIATVSNDGVVTGVAAGTAVITVTAQSAESGAFAASSITALVPVTVSPNAQVAITNITIASTNDPIDISNVQDQIQVNLAIQPNGQTVTEANVWVCNAGEAVAACMERTNGVPAARQSFTTSGSQATNVNLFINTAEFNTPNFETGADAVTLYKNGLKTIVATLATSPAAASTIASNSISQVNFNNPDGWTVRWVAPANRAISPSNITWYGGPSTPDPLTPNAQSGTGSFTIVPVIYTPNRTVVQVSANLSTACGAAITTVSRPFTFSYGTSARNDTDASALNFNCSGVASTTDGLAPRVLGAIDDNQNGFPGTTATPGVGRSIFSDFTNIANSTPDGFRQSLSYHPNYLYLPHDYAAPAISAFNVKGGSHPTNAVYQDSAWVNASYFLVGTNPISATGAGAFRYRISDADVGLTSSTGLEYGSGAATRNTVFSICSNPGAPTTGSVNCTTPVAQGGISSTIGSLNVPEHATNFTNSAYIAQVVETDRLGNRATSVVFGASQTPSGNGNNGWPTAFGVDLTPPTVVVLPNTGPGSLTGYARTDVDSIYTHMGTGLNAPGHLPADSVGFGIRFTDNRAGFPLCSAGVNCPAFAAGTEVNAGTFSITRRTAPSLVSVQNDAVVQNIVNTANRLNVINAQVSGYDAAYRDFQVAISGSITRAAGLTLTSGNPAPTVAGYYTFAGTLVDRAGNSTTLPNRSVAIDNESPKITGIQVPAVLQGGTTVGFGPAGTDDLEAIAGDLALRYPQLAFNDGAGAAVVGQPSTLRFRRVTHYSASAPLGFWHNPFAAVTDNKLTTPIGPGTTLGSAQLNVPIPFISHLTTVTAGNAPLDTTGIYALNLSAGDPRPDSVKAWLYDIRGTSPLAFTDTGRSTVLVQPIFGGQIPSPSSAFASKRWGTITGGAGIQTWQIFTNGAGESEFRAQTPTSVTNPPFTAVYIVRQVGSTEWEYIGTATYAGPLDQGGNRYWRYTLSSAAIAQGNGVVMAALANGDQIKAIGVDGSGNGLATATSTYGLPLALPSNTTITGAFPATIANGDGATAVALTVSANPNAANITYSCVSSNPGFVTATMTGPAECTVSDNGVAASTFNVTVTVTATGSLAGFTTNSVVRTVTISREP